MPTYTNIICCALNGQKTTLSQEQQLHEISTSDVNGSNVVNDVLTDVICFSVFQGKHLVSWF